MEYVHVADEGDLAPGQMKQAKAGAQSILLANLGGTYHAIDKKCPHLGGNLCKGKLEETTVRCPLHGARFDVTTGAVVRDAKLLFLTFKTKNVKTYPVKREGTRVLVGV